MRNLETRLEENPVGDGHGVMRSRLTELRNVLVGDGLDAVFGDDHLSAYWSWQAEQGIVPDLNMAPNDPRVVEWARERRRRRK